LRRLAERRRGWGSWTPCSAPPPASCAAPPAFSSAPPAPRPASCSARERERGADDWIGEERPIGIRIGAAGQGEGSEKEKKGIRKEKEKRNKEK